MHHPAHQFNTLEQQYEADNMGMWIFLATEILFFGGLFGGYIVYRNTFPDAWAVGSSMNSVLLGAAMTVVLLSSSLSMAFAVRASQLGHQKMLQVLLLLTIVLGLAFMGMKAFEYYDHWHHGLVPGLNFTGYHGPNASQVALFLSFYFIMTGLHALHMIIGVGLLSVLVILARRGKFTPEYFAPVDLCGLYWHFVDVIWIFLFPLLYLVGHHL